MPIAYANPTAQDLARDWRVHRHARYLTSTPPSTPRDWRGVRPFANRSAPPVKPGSSTALSTHRSWQLFSRVQFAAELDSRVFRGLRGLHLFRNNLVH